DLPPGESSKTKVFLWELHGGTRVRKAGIKNLYEDYWTAHYGPKQRRYDSFHDEWDMCTEFDPSDVPRDFDEFSDGELADNYPDDNPPITAGYTAGDYLGRLHRSALPSKMPHKPVYFELSLRALAHRRFGFAPPESYRYPKCTNSDIKLALIIGTKPPLRSYLGRPSLATPPSIGRSQAVLDQCQPQKEDIRNTKLTSLFAITGQSNITNTKNPLSAIQYAASLGYNTLLDAAALAPSSQISLEDTPVDAMAISFYKMFGYPTGVGALVIKKSFLEQLRRPWFAGGNVDVVQVPGNVVTMSEVAHERFEDGTINYLTLSAVTDGLRFLSAYLPFLPLRLSSLTSYLATSLSQLKHQSTGKPVVRILSRIPRKKVRALGEQSDTGSMVSLIFLSPSGQMIPNSFIEYSASKHNISLRTGCMCNPGGAAAILGIEQDMQRLYPGVTLKDFEEIMGRELGVVRISLGLGSDFRDVWNVIRFASLMADDVSWKELWDNWLKAGLKGPLGH
ncbi:hypothetical protein V5O48_016261, partial [Marasmius crinis-equi]